MPSRKPGFDGTSLRPVFSLLRKQFVITTVLLQTLEERGLRGVQLIISDACLGLSGSAAEFFPEAAWQRCVVHWYRNIFSHVPSTKVELRLFAGQRRGRFNEDDLRSKHFSWVSFNYRCPSRIFFSRYRFWDLHSQT